jgi:hypothetical protein
MAANCICRTTTQLGWKLRWEASGLLSHPGEGDWSQWTIRVTNEAGRLVATVAVADMRTRAA